MTAQKVQYSKCLPFISIMSANLCIGDRGKKFMSCQPEVPKVKEIWHTAERARTHTHTSKTLQKWENETADKDHLGGCYYYTGLMCECIVQWLQDIGQKCLVES